MSAAQVEKWTDVRDTSLAHPAQFLLEFSHLVRACPVGPADGPKRESIRVAGRTPWAPQPFAAAPDSRQDRNALVAA